ncbi:MAG: hypothetical protein ABH983_05685, partial [Candidatus Micrarchaeota archaeon]
MFNYSYFTDSPAMWPESSLIVGSYYDFYDHVVQQNKRDDERRVVYESPENILQPIAYNETCERCGKNLEVRV